MQKGTQLKLDYDHDNWFQLYDERMRILKWLFEFEVLKERFFESKGGGHHVRVWIDMELQPREISLFQTILGSDPVREAFNLRRIRAGQKNWNVLFTPKKEILTEVAK